MNIRIFRQVLRLLAMVLALAITSTAFAQTDAATTIKMDDFDSMMQAMKVTGEGYYTIFIDEGVDLAKAFFWISLVWLLFKLVLSDKHLLRPEFSEAR